MKRLAAALLFAVVGFAQQTEMKNQIIEVKNVKAEQLRSMAMPIFFNGGSIGHTSDNRYLIVQGSSDKIASVEALVRQFDVPPRDIELTFHIIAASTQPNAEKLPADLDPVLKQLRSAFVYQGYKLLETAFMRVREGDGGEVSGSLPGNAIYQIRCLAARVSTGTPNVIRLDNLRIGGRFPVTTNAKGEISYVDTGINTSVDMKEGQKIVVGKSTVNDSAAFLVVSARVLE